ncbi:Hypothetical protein SCF082_LOCUS30496 [Durusdinium trenchii]|uniref:C3H1-type domain-containing protein n=1 Tax=Durusdinium trenchii TaxID=1381693 RepID=A0ABP0MYN4_9DINO
MMSMMAEVGNVDPRAELHFRGECIPCRYLRRPNGCARGDACRFCHLCTDKQMKIYYFNLRREVKEGKQKSTTMITLKEDTILDTILAQKNHPKEATSGFDFMEQKPQKTTIWL